MYILVINCGSSSIKTKLIERSNFSTVFEARAEHLTSEASIITVKTSTGKKQLPTDGILNHKMALQEIINYLVTNSIILSLDEISCVGHRVVHGGTFSKPMVINNEVLTKIWNCRYLAPSHIPVNIMGIEHCQKILPEVPQVAVFDTAFHQTIPKNNYTYAIPEELRRKDIRKYGFHGSSYAFLVRQLSSILGSKEDIYAIICHIGNGVSVSAIINGVSVSNSMGLTPTGGSMMGGRVGDIDPGIIPYMCNNCGYTVNEAYDILNKNSGLTALTGTNNMLEILERMKKGDQDCIDAFDMFCKSVAKNIASCMVDLGEEPPRQIVFSGGIGENSDIVRETILKKLASNLSNIHLDADANKNNATEITHFYSAVRVYVIPTDEEIEIAMEASELV